MENPTIVNLLHVDHEPLTWLRSQQRPSRRQARWLEYLARYRYEIVYVKGDQNIIADCLSRMLRLDTPQEEEARLPTDYLLVHTRTREHQGDNAMGAGRASSETSLNAMLYRLRNQRESLPSRPPGVHSFGSRGCERGLESSSSGKARGKSAEPGVKQTRTCSGSKKRGTGYTKQNNPLYSRILCGAQSHKGPKGLSSSHT